MERITAPGWDGERIVIRLLRHYAGLRDLVEDDTGLSRLVALGESLSLSPAGSVAMASVFQLTEAVLGRPLVTERCCASCLSTDEQAVIRLLGSPVPTKAGTATRDMPHGMPGALSWAILSVRQLCGDLVPSIPRATAAAPNRCPFAYAVQD